MVFIIIGCSTPSASFAKKTMQLDFRPLSLQGLLFTHTIYENDKTSSLFNTRNVVLHVYLGGDGTPWLKGRYINSDPTPLNPVMLRLMYMDTYPAIYLGRPCYHQHKMEKTTHCDYALWTNKRYSMSVVNSMVVALERYIQQYNKHNLTIKLFGFSGGGTLAMLIAPRVQNVTHVVTLAANLDTESWTKHHGYEPLTGSLNPAKQPPLPHAIQQLHLMGKQDKIVPAFLNQPVIEKQHNARYRILKQADHRCCWTSIWSSVLDELKH